jgi:hypothetical protein
VSRFRVTPKEALQFPFVAPRSDDSNNGGSQVLSSSSVDTTTEHVGYIADRGTGNCTAESAAAVANGASSNRSSATIP